MDFSIGSGVIFKDYKDKLQYGIVARVHKPGTKSISYTLISELGVCFYFFKAKSRSKFPGYIDIEKSEKIVPKITSNLSLHNQGNYATRFKCPFDRLAITEDYVPPKISKFEDI